MAPPRMLGELRRYLNDEVDAHLAGALDKDLTRMPAARIAQQLNQWQ